MSKQTHTSRRTLRKANKQQRKAQKRGIHGRLRYLKSNFRLSLTFRIAIHYCWQLLRTSLLAMLIVSLIYAGTVLADIEDDMRRLRNAIPDPSGVFSQQVIQDESVSAVLLDVHYSGEAGLFKYRLLGISMQYGRPYLLAESTHLSGQAIRLEINLYRPLVTWLWLMLAVLLVDGLRMLIFIKRREKLNKSVLAPIHDITEMAQTLSANNLSNRINIAGTKNELKDLASVINSMLDRIERSYNSQKQFVSDASHELRTPIAVIQGYVSMLNRWGKEDPEVLEEGISAIAQETESMKDLVESLLFLARHDKKTLMMEMSRFDALEVAEELHREAAMVTPGNTFLLSPADSCMIEADRNMIKQVMRILCDNAVKYTPKGGTITIGVKHEPGWCTLSVSDNGPGIPSDELPKIFERFYRSDSARKSEGGGHGLGLSIARIIVKAHGGKLRVRSKVGMGSTFFVVLPEKQQGMHEGEAAD